METQHSIHFTVLDRIQWFLFVDLEGFRHLHNHQRKLARRLFIGLLEDLFYLGEKVFPSGIGRLFIHQIGDGFLIKSDFGDTDLQAPVAISIALLRSTLVRGGCLKISLGTGEIADLKGCLPNVIRARMDSGNMVRIGDGLMTLFTVMGTGLIDSYSRSIKQSGPVLLIPKAFDNHIRDLRVTFRLRKSWIAVDWVHAELDSADAIQGKLHEGSIDRPYPMMLSEYLNTHRASLGKDWTKSAEDLVRGYSRTRSNR